MVSRINLALLRQLGLDAPTVEALRHMEIKIGTTDHGPTITQVQMLDDQRQPQSPEALRALRETEELRNELAQPRSLEAQEALRQVDDLRNELQYTQTTLQAVLTRLDELQSQIERGNPFNDLRSRIDELEGRIS